MIQQLKKSAAALMSGILLATAVPAFSLEGAAADCVIDTSKTYQTIDGFGGINHPEWTSDKGGDLSAAQRQTAFGNGDNELGFTVLRVFVNPNSGAWKNAVPTAQFAYKAGAKVFASPWEPPSNIAESGGSNGKLHLPKSNYGAYAKHLNDFGNYMKENGVDLWSISVQNEPDYAKEWTYWSTDEACDFIANYGDQITSTRLMSPESFQYGRWSGSGKEYYKKILANSKAFANCDLFGTHFYGTSRSDMDFPELEACGKPIWMTEVYVPDSNIEANAWPKSLDLAENMHNGLVVGNMSAYVVWYIRRSYGPMTDDGKISKRGYLMAQYSKYVRPNAKRVDATEQPASNVLVSAYKNEDGSIAVVAINKNTNAVNQTFSIPGESISSIDRIRTSGSENLAKGTVTANGSSFSDSLPAQSTTTYVIGAKVEPLEVDKDGYWFHDTFEDGDDGWSGRGGASAAQSSANAYKGSNALAVTDRSSAWNGAQKTLSTRMFEPGKEYSFAAVAAPSGGSMNMMLSLQYTDASGETAYDHIANGTAADGNYVLLANSNYTIPAGASNIILYVETEEGTNNFYVDEVIGAPAGTQFDGPAPTQPVVTKLGDCNGDGKITAVDMSMAKAYCLKGNGSAAVKKAADVDQNGTVEVADIVWFAKYLTGQVTEFPTPVAPPKPQTRTLSQYVPVCNDNLAMNEPDTAKQNKGGVNYGTLESKSYYSNFCGRNKPYHVLLPAGYTTSKKYPVMYIMHGYWENQDRMIIKGNGTMYTQQIIGNAIAEGAAKEMICVFPYIFSSKTKNDCDGMNDANNEAYDNFETVLINELMPLIEKDYSVATGKENTAITGFSMGGRESLNIGMRHQDIFGYVGAICPAPGASGPWSVKSDESAPYLIYITAGGNDQTVYTTPEGYHNSLTQNNTPHVWHYYPSGYHGDNSIHAHLYNFVRFAFQA